MKISNKRLLSMLLALVMVFSLAACSSKTANQTEGSAANEDSEVAETGYTPVSITNNDLTITYEKAPERVIPYSYSTAEILVALGVGDRIIGIAATHSRIEDMQEQYISELEKIPVLTDGLISLEGALEADPDLVIGDVYNFMERNCGAREDYLNAGVNVYIQEGTYVEGATYENTYNDIINLGKIFGVEDRAEELVSEMKQTVSDVESKVADLDPVSVFLYDSGEGTLYSVGKDSLESMIAKTAGGENIFSDVDGHYVDVSVEAVLEKNPDAIIVFDYFVEDGKDADGKVDYLKSLPEWADVPAIKNNNILVVPYANITPSLENAVLTQTIAEFLHADAF